jgi:mono/diheme cytochrome c family protein
MQDQLLAILGSPEKVTLFETEGTIEPVAGGSLFAKLTALAETRAAHQQLEQAAAPLAKLCCGNQAKLKTGPVLGSYHRGREQFVCQACYACHRIAGFSRGTVGPDLSDAGHQYPWYLKASIVWPQGKLRYSAMPNFKLDHEEVEDLLAFLLAQRCNPAATSPVEQKCRLKAWEQGEPLPWEEPISPDQIRQVHYGMEVFATEGCAACHKLQGFDGAVAYSEPHTAQHWFRATFPEQLSGRDLIHRLDKQAAQIDRYLIAGEPGMLELLEQKYPGVIETFYSSFKCAMRAKRDPAWKERVALVRTMYIQEYGLGRDIAPRLNWSGVWRDDQWLMGHFLNPSGYTARSIMPAMPFDETKFHALNHMLHVLGARNRDRLRQQWQERGFDPQLAYEQQCAACHGNYKEGNGVIAETIYPVPKNLRNSAFLVQHLTCEQAIRSITHGVPGSPMPPWGVAVQGPPVMAANEIEQLVDWIYSSLPGTAVISEQDSMVKWQYNTDQVLSELQKEGEPTPHLFVQRDDGAYFQPAFFTHANRATGERLFVENCSHCHGKEGAGNGQRAESMVGAKPRMLSNLHWIQDRDDLGLLRSIKFGVAGTAMTPWGDKTSALQRLQLVVYIRSLSEEKRLRDQLHTTLYNTFETKRLGIEEQRIASASELAALEIAFEEAMAKRQALAEMATPAEAAAAYQHELTLREKLRSCRADDQQLCDQIAAIQSQRLLYEALGEAVIGKNLDASLVEDYLACVRAGDDPTCEEHLMSQLDQLLEELAVAIEIAKGMLPSEQRTLELNEFETEQRSIASLKNKLQNGLQQARGAA